MNELCKAGSAAPTQIFHRRGGRSVTLGGMVEHSELPCGESAEVAPGVVVERRSFLAVAAAAFAGGGSRALAAQSAEPVSLERFLEEVLPVARELVGDVSQVGEDRYLHTLASYAVTLGDIALPAMRQSGQGEGTEIGASWVGDPFVVLHWRMQPNAEIRLHAHTYGNVVTVGLDGSARVRNFETIEEPDFGSEEPILLRRTNDQVLLPGRINLVPLSHGFVHGFRAGPAGARGLDITTRLRDRQPTPYLDVEAEPTDAAAAVFRGHWTE